MSTEFAVQTDIGWAVKKMVLSTEDRVLFMKPWKPQEQIELPFSAGMDWTRNAPERRSG